MKVMVKKCLTDQRFILKIITSYKIHNFKRNYINSVNAPVSCGQLSLLGVTQSKRILVDPDGKGINDVPIQVSIKTVTEIQDDSKRHLLELSWPIQRLGIKSFCFRNKTILFLKIESRVNWLHIFAWYKIFGIGTMCKSIFGHTKKIE